MNSFDDEIVRRVNVGKRPRTSPRTPARKRKSSKWENPPNNEITKNLPNDEITRFQRSPLRSFENNSHLVSHSTSSPSVENLLSQDDSFFDQYVEDIECGEAVEDIEKKDSMGTISPVFKSSQKRTNDKTLVESVDAGSDEDMFAEEKDSQKFTDLDMLKVSHKEPSRDMFNDSQKFTDLDMLKVSQKEPSRDMFNDSQKGHNGPSFNIFKDSQKGPTRDMFNDSQKVQSRDMFKDSQRGSNGPSLNMFKDSQNGPSMDMFKDSQKGPSRDMFKDRQKGPNGPSMDMFKDSQNGPSRDMFNDSQKGPSRNMFKDSQKGPNGASLDMFKASQKGQSRDMFKDSQMRPISQKGQNSQLRSRLELDKLKGSQVGSDVDIFSQISQVIVATPSEDSQQILSLPMSVLDVRSKALEELEEKRKSIVPSQKPTSKTEQSVFSNKNLISESCDRGPFFGLPSKVAELYEKNKNVKDLFDWQKRCLNSQAIQEKKNLLYSLPTSGGKTLVAEIIMLQEILCYKKNVIFVLPYVSLVHEKIRSLAPFALDLGFNLEEYAGPKGKFPPVKRKQKRSLYVCTIEKAHSLYNHLVIEGRVDEVGLVVVDEVHMVGEEGRGANLESFLSKILFLNKKSSTPVQLVAMSATVGNLKEVSGFLMADLFTDSWRPVKLEEFVKVGRDVMEINPNKNCPESEQFKFKRKVNDASYNAAMKRLDEDHLAALVLEVFPAHSCLVFCDSKRRCESVAELLSKMIFNMGMISKQVQEHRKEGKQALIAALQSESSGFICPVLAKTVQFGIGYHHSGLTMDERKALEDGFLSGVLGVLCCTSTLAAGVNLPARRVIIRSPYMGRNLLTHGQYKQMAGRAGRAGMDTCGESILLVKQSLVKLVPGVVAAPVEHCVSSLHKSDGRGLAALIMNCLHLGVVKNPGEVNELLAGTLMSKQAGRLGIDTAGLVSASFSVLLTGNLIAPDVDCDLTQQQVTADTGLKPTRLGRACVAGNVDLTRAERLYNDLKAARVGLAVDTSLHLLYLITPYDIADYAVHTASGFNEVYLELAEPELNVARALGVTEGLVVGIMRGKSGGKHMEPIMARLYLALMLFDLWNAKPVHLVAEKFKVSRGQVQQLMSSAASFASCVFHFCQELEEFWAYQELLEPFAARLSSCCSPELLPLLDIAGVKAGRAKQLYEAGYKDVPSISSADPGTLVKNIEHLSHKAALLMVQSAKLFLLERAETLREEADTVLLDINW